MVTSVFISYRRFPSAYTARAVFLALTQKGIDTFLDVESIPAGDFERVILTQIAIRRNFLLILAPETLTRCKDPNDWLRREILHALQTQRNIIPILFFLTPSDLEAELIPELRPLLAYSPVVMIHDYFNAIMGDIISRRLLPDTPQEKQVLTDYDRQIVQKAKDIALTAPTSTQAQIKADEKVMFAIQLAQRNDYQRAVDFLSSAIRLNPNHRHAYLKRGEYFMELGSYTHAHTDFTHAVQLAPTNGEAYLMRGRLLMKIHHYTDALEDLNATLMWESNNDEAYILRGRCHMANKAYALAEQDYQQALTLSPQNYKAYAYRGVLYYELGDYPKAIEDYNSAVYFKNDYALGYYNRGLCWWKLGKLALAEQDFRLALQAEKHYLDPYLALARLHHELGDIQHTRLWLGQASLIAPDSSEVRAVSRLLNA